MFYCSERRAKVKEENPNFSAADITRLIGEEWAKLTTEDKQV